MAYEMRSTCGSKCSRVCCQNSRKAKIHPLVWEKSRIKKAAGLRPLSSSGMGSMDRDERIKILEAARSLATLEHDCDGAILRVDEVLRENPDDPDGLMLKGNILDLDERHEEALECYKRVLHIDPQNVAALIDMGDSHSWSGNYDEAVKFFDRALGVLRQGKYYLDPRDELESAYRGKLGALREGGKSEEARACELEMHRLFPRRGG